ncbi:MAG: mechanosensitive ion channel family protein [Anaerolineae bacterium]|nr:mechanosensitive ion channel family protein [Anaerolineae bacterium]
MMNVVLIDSLQLIIADLIRFVPRLIVALMVFVVTLLLSRPVTRAVKQTALKHIDNDEMVGLLSGIIRWSIISTGLLVALDQVNFDITGFVAGLGIAGITVGFALQDIARNFVAGLLLFVRRPFQVGSAVKIGGFSGIVQEIATRDTMLRTWDGEQVIISNSSVLENPISNYSALSLRRRTVIIGLGYGQNAQEAMRLFAEAVRETPGVQGEPAPSVYAEALDDSTMRLAARFWIDTKKDDLFKVHSDVVVALSLAAEQSGIELPYPIQSIQLRESQ